VCVCERERKCVCVYVCVCARACALSSSAAAGSVINAAQSPTLQVLTLKAMGINDLLGFDFMDPPPAATLVGFRCTYFCLSLQLI